MTIQRLVDMLSKYDPMDNVALTDNSGNVYLLLGDEYTVTKHSELDDEFNTKKGTVYIYGK